jgi:hypothetical protein
MKVTIEEIINQMEQIQTGQSLTFSFPAVFGGGRAIIGLNPQYPGKGEKKYVLKLGKDEVLAEKTSPILTSDKPKHLAKWITERFGEQVG